MLVGGWEGVDLLWLHCRINTVQSLAWNDTNFHRTRRCSVMLLASVSQTAFKERRFYHVYFFSHSVTTECILKIDQIYYWICADIPLQTTHQWIFVVKVHIAIKTEVLLVTYIVK